MKTRDELEAMSTPMLMGLARENGVSTDQVALRPDLINVLLGEHVTTEESQPFFEPEQLEQPEPEPAPAPAPAPEPVPEGPMTTIEAADMLVNAHSVPKGTAFSKAHRRALSLAIQRLINYEITVMGELKAEPTDFVIRTEDIRIGRIYAKTFVSLPDADDAAYVVVAGDSGDTAQPILRFQRMRNRFRVLRRS